MQIILPLKVLRFLFIPVYIKTFCQGAFGITTTTKTAMSPVGHTHYYTGLIHTGCFKIQYICPIFRCL